MLAAVVACCFCAATLLVIVVLVVNGRQQPRPSSRGRRATTPNSGGDGEVSGSDLPALNPATAFVKTDVGLGCKAGACKFGLYSIKSGDTTITLSDHLAGAVFKVTHAGVEFVVPMAIVGGSMQTALVYDGHGAYNPTWAGTGNLDSFTGKTSSKLLELRGTKTAVYAKVRAAYFNEPGKVSKGITTANTTVLSDTTMSARIEFVDASTVDYSVGILFGPRHWFMLAEVLCCWTPRAASARMQVLTGGSWKDAPDALHLYFADACDGLVMGTSSGRAAMGVKLLSYPTGARWETARYGTPESNATWRKWSITQRINPQKDETYALPRGPWTWRMRLFFGGFEDVKARVARAAT